MGGMIAQELALRHPERVKTLVSIMSTTGDPSLRGPSYELSTSLLKPFPDERAGFVRRSLEVAHAIAGHGFPLDEDLVRQIAARAYDRDHDQAGVRRQIVAIFTQRNRHAALAAVRIPTLVIHGADDPLVPLDGGRDTASAIPGARLEIIAGMGHELPRAVWPRVIGLIAQLAQARAPSSP
jgi:pimeloyl-ACP methyl ester carboxylesterase